MGAGDVGGWTTKVGGPGESLNALARCSAIEAIAGSSVRDRIASRRAGVEGSCKSRFEEGVDSRFDSWPWNSDMIPFKLVSGRDSRFRGFSAGSGVDEEAVAMAFFSSTSLTLILLLFNRRTVASSAEVESSVLLTRTSDSSSSGTVIVGVGALGSGLAGSTERFGVSGRSCMCIGSGGTGGVNAS